MLQSRWTVSNSFHSPLRKSKKCLHLVRCNPDLIKCYQTYQTYSACTRTCFNDILLYDSAAYIKGYISYLWSSWQGIWFNFYIIKLLTRNLEWLGCHHIIMLYINQLSPDLIAGPVPLKLKKFKIQIDRQNTQGADSRTTRQNFHYWSVRYSERQGLSSVQMLF